MPDKVTRKCDHQDEGRYDCDITLDDRNLTGRCYRHQEVDESDPGTPADFEPVIVNKRGGKQHKIDGRYDLISPIAMTKVAKILGEGAEKYGDWNWHKIESTDHINHVLRHIFLYIQGDDREDHLGNALCRMIFAVDRASVEDVHVSPYEISRVGSPSIASCSCHDPKNCIRCKGTGVVKIKL